MTKRAIKHKKLYRYEVFTAYLLIRGNAPALSFFHDGLKHKKVKGIFKRILRQVRRMDKERYNFIMSKLLEMKKEKK